MNILRIVVFCSLAVSLSILPGALLAAGTASELTIQNTAIQKMLMDELFKSRIRCSILSVLMPSSGKSAANVMKSSEIKSECMNLKLHYIF